MIPTIPTIPEFAVVGRVNEGKSSIIATLVESDTVKIGPDPGTTRKCQRLTMDYHGRPLFAVIDTPGFQEPEAALEWLKHRDKSAVERPEAVREFVRTFAGSGRFADECELLQPILAGAYVLYVIDSSHPFRPSYEAELEILRWTGMPRMALINRIGGTDYSSEWQKALSQYFNIIKVFNAHGSHLLDRVELLRAMQVLGDDIKAALEEAVRSLTRLAAQRQRDAALLIASLLADACGLQMSHPLGDEVLSEECKRRFSADYHAEIVERERLTRRKVERLYNFNLLKTVETPFKGEIFEEDLFSATTWEFLGLSKAQLIAAGTLAGAAAGSAIDVMVGGHSFLLGAVIGTVAGFGSTTYLSFNAPTQQLVGVNIAGRQATVGPIKAPNFPWIMLDRALLHYRALMQRTHAMRDTLEISHEKAKGIVSGFDLSTRNAIARFIPKMRRGRDPQRQIEKLADLLEPVLKSLSS